jgi:hypothetical protein
VNEQREREQTDNDTIEAMTVSGEKDALWAAAPVEARIGGWTNYERWRLRDAGSVDDASNVCNARPTYLDHHKVGHALAIDDVHAGGGETAGGGESTVLTFAGVLFVSLSRQVTVLLYKYQKCRRQRVALNNFSGVGDMCIIVYE